MTRAGLLTSRRPELAVLLALVLFLTLVGVVAPDDAAPRARAEAAPHTSTTPHAPKARRPVPRLPGGGTRVFDHRFLVAYYGTPQTTRLGVLGEGGPRQVTSRLREAARPFHRRGQRPQIVYELIATVVDGGPGDGGDYSHEIPRRYVEQYIRAAHRNKALLVLDLQPGRTDFLTVAKRWAWALKDPWVGLALDPEWRMGPKEVPARRVGHVTAREVNRTTAWLERLTVRHRLPEKVLVLHQFRTSMVRNPGAVRDRRHLAEVQHVDGFGPPRGKLATYHRVARPRQFRMGFKLFYDEDKPRMTPRQVLRIRPRVDFVSFQ